MEQTDIIPERLKTKRFPKLKSLSKNISFEFEQIQERKKETLQTTMDVRAFRNLVIKQMILKDEMTYAQIGAQFFPPLCDRQICEIAMSIGIRKSEKRLRAWTATDEELLKEKYGKVPLNQLAKLLRRSTKSLSWKASCLGLSSEIMLSNQKSMYWGGHNRRAYSKEDDDFIKNNLRMPLAEVANHLKRDVRSVVSHRTSLGLKHELQDGKKRTLWSDADIQFLKDNPQMPMREIEIALNKPKEGIATKRSKFGIKYNKREFTDDEILIIKSDMTIDQKIKAVRASHASITEKMKEFGVYIKREKDGVVCPNCGSLSVFKRGKELQSTVVKQIYRCSDCNRGWRVEICNYGEK
jgi:DNA-directed RNA polymerase subunit RPC12/RpoP